MQRLLEELPSSSSEGEGHRDKIRRKVSHCKAKTKERGSEVEGEVGRRRGEIRWVLMPMGRWWRWHTDVPTFLYPSDTVVVRLRIVSVVALMGLFDDTTCMVQSEEFNSRTSCGEEEMRTDWRRQEKSNKWFRWAKAYPQSVLLTLNVLFILCVS